jgi:4-amino-4-deoxy-L-arabinose transferase-like glycosyltransferase
LAGSQGEGFGPAAQKTIRGSAMLCNKTLVLKNNWLKLGLVVVVLLAFLIRIGVVFTFEMPNFSYGENSAIAVNMVEGKGYTYGFYGLRPDKPLQSFVPPLYSWIVWLCLESFNDAAHALGIIHAVLSTASLPLIFYLTHKLSGDKIGAFLTTFCVAFYPPVILSIVRPQTLTLNIFLVALLLAICAKLYEEQNKTWSIVFGFTLGIGLHSRPMLLIIFLILVIWFYLNSVAKKKLLMIGFTIMISTIIVLIPWSVRNYRIHQQFVFMAANSGFNFWTGNNSFTTGSGHEVYTDRAYEFMNKEIKQEEPAIQEMHRYPLPAHIAERIATIDEVELDRQLYQAGFKYIQEHPAEWLQLMWVKFKSFIWFRPNIGNRYDETWTLYYRYLYAMLLVPFVIGIYLSITKWKKYSLLYMLFASYAGFYTFFQVQMRYRWEIEPYFFVFIALTLIVIIEKIGGHILGFKMRIE